MMSRRPSRVGMLAGLVLGLAASAGTAPAQRPTTPDGIGNRPLPTLGSERASTNAQAVIARGREYLDGLAYDSTRQLVQEYLAVGRIPARERRELLQLAATSSFSEDGSATDRAAARRWLEALVRLDPDAALMREYAWSGLDTLLADVKRETFGAAARFQPRYELVGTRVSGRVDVVATRPTHFALRVNRRGFDDAFTMDSTDTPVTNGSLRLAAHDGVRALMSDGLYELRVVAYDAATSDSIIAPVVTAQAQGAEPFLMDLPLMVAERNLLPEWRAPARVEGLAFGLVAGLATVAIAQYARGPSPLRENTTVDGRARGIAVLIAAAAATAGWFDRGRPIRENMLANQRVREQYEREARFATRYNETWIANFRVVLLLDQEDVR